MVDILIQNGDFLELGTTGNDAVTFEQSIFGAVDMNAGNGGMDTATLQGDTLLTLGGLTYNAATGWALAGADSFDMSFGSLTTADGITLVGGTALSGIANPAAATLADPLDGSYSADPTTAQTYAWDGALLATTPTATNYFVAAVDGNPVGNGTTFITSDGAGSITVVDVDALMAGGVADIEFTPNTAALSAGQNVGDQVSFTYDVVLEDALGNQITVQQTFTVTVDWTAGADTAMGTDLNDQIIDGGAIVNDGGDGIIPSADDTNFVSLSGLDGGDDLLQGGGGDDMLVGGAGNDTLFGGSGNDSLTDAGAPVVGESNMMGGGAGADILTAGANAGNLFGAGGNDLLFGGGGNDSLKGGGGDDIINGGAGNNIIRGGDGDDIIIGGAGNDTIKGGDGMDTISVTGGNNVVFTSQGDGDTIDLAGGLLDTVVMKNGTGMTAVANFGAAAGDSVDVSDLGYTSFAEVLANSYQTDVDGTGTDSTVILGADSSLVLTGVTLAALVDANFDYA